MTVDQVLGQIQQIRSQLALLSPQRPAAGSGTAFTSALSAATSGARATSSATAVDGATPASGGVTGDDVVQAALQYKGVPYVLGGESRSGIDCSGLVQASFKDLGVDVPRLVHEQQTLGEKVDSLKDAKPGDLIVLNGGDHIAIWMGNDTVVHAPYPGRTVSVQKAWFDDKDVVTIRRVVPAGDGTSPASTTVPAATAAAPTTSATGVTGVTGSSSAGALSAASMARAVGMLGMYGAESGSEAGSGSSSLSSMLGALTGTGSSSTSSMASMLGTSAGGTASTSTAQQLLAARAAMLESGAA